MRSYWIKRVLMLVPVLLAASTLVFFLIHFLPGDPIDIILGERAIVAERETMRRSLHLDQPLSIQYVIFLKGLVSMNLGESLFEHRPVMKIILERYPATLLLALSAMFLALFLSTLLGTIAAARKDTLWDRGSLFAGLIGISIPHFWLGPLLVILFSVKLNWFPPSGRDSLLGLVLPSVTLASGLAAFLTRLTRSSLLETLREDYVKTARAKGVSEKSVLLKHAFRNALHPLVTVMGLQFGALLGGAIVTEKIFAWPGIGSLLIQSIERRDYPVVQGCILLIAFTYSLVNLGTDLIHARLDPRIRLETSS